jgi:hypothetical protein
MNFRNDNQEPNLPPCHLPFVFDEMGGKEKILIRDNESVRFAVGGDVIENLQQAVRAVVQ